MRAGGGSHGRSNPERAGSFPKLRSQIGGAGYEALVAARVIADRYTLRDQLGRGGMGTVWRADDLYLERAVAVKEVFQADPTRLLREGRAAARLRIPSAVTVFDVLEEDGNAYLVMELVDAVNLSELVGTGRATAAPERVAQIGLALLDALATRPTSRASSIGT